MMYSGDPKTGPSGFRAILKPNFLKFSFGMVYTILKPDYFSGFRMVFVAASLDCFIKKRVINFFYSCQNGLVFDHPKTGQISPVLGWSKTRPFWHE